MSRLGRFAAVDPLPQRGRNPQSLNGYSYSHNDPIGRDDPSGMLDNLVCGPLGDCGGGVRSFGGDHAGDMAAGEPSLDTGASGPWGSDVFGCDPNDPFNPCDIGVCDEFDPSCGMCEPMSGCSCDPILGPDHCDDFPKVGWAHYLELLALLRNLLVEPSVKPPLATCHCSRENEKPRVNGRCYYRCTRGAGLKLIGGYESEESYHWAGWSTSRGAVRFPRTAGDRQRAGNGLLRRGLLPLRRGTGVHR